MFENEGLKSIECERTASGTFVIVDICPGWSIFLLNSKSLPACQWWKLSCWMHNEIFPIETGSVF